jgi:hypothetical protein
MGVRVEGRAVHLRSAGSGEGHGGGGEGLGLGPGGGGHEAADVGGGLRGAVGGVPRHFPPRHRVAHARVERVVELRRARAGRVRTDGGVGARALHDGVADGAVRGPGSESGLVVHRVDLPAEVSAHTTEATTPGKSVKEHVPGNRCQCSG